MLPLVLNSVQPVNPWPKGLPWWPERWGAGVPIIRSQTMSSLMQELLAQSSFDKLKEGAIVPGTTWGGIRIIGYNDHLGGGTPCFSQELHCE